VQDKQRDERQQDEAAEHPHVGNECRSGYQHSREEDEQDGKEEVGAGVVVAVRNREFGDWSVAQILTGNVVGTGADIPIVDILLRRGQSIILGRWSLLGHVDAEKECRRKPRGGGEHDPGRCPVKPGLSPSRWTIP
jgi:hypothetical protein